MNSRSWLEVAGGILLIFFGILFFLGFGTDLWDLATDAIFVGFGILTIRNAYSKSRQEPSSEPREKQTSREKRQKSKRNTS